MTPAQADRIERIARAIEVLGGSDGGPPETDASLDALEAGLGRRLPPEVRAIYGLFAAGSELAGGDGTSFEPLLDGDLAVVRYADQLRVWGWAIPEDVVAFASDDGGRVYGLWLPADGRAVRHPVVCIDPGSSDDRPTMGVVAQDLPALVATRLALLQFEHAAGLTVELQTVLGVPVALRGDPDDRIPPGVAGSEADALAYDPILRWASPDVPEVAYDIYRGTTVADVRRIADRP
jgi:hypothetical protein